MARASLEGPPVAQAATGQEPQVKNLLVIMSGIMLGVLLAALDQTVVGPAMPQIIGDLSGFDRYVWPFTAYMLTSTIVVPISGKLGDLYGRKWFYIAGIVVFLIGSMLSGLSQTMDQLIYYRALQGVGGGIMFANALAIIGDLVPPADRGRWQGLFGAVWGLASVFGPTVGGYLTDSLDWRWVFYVNLPVGLLALGVLVVTLPDLRPKLKARPSIDWLGAVVLSAGLTPLLMALSLGGGEGWAWDSPQTIGLIAGGLALLVAFVAVEARAKEPIIPLDLFKNSIFNLSVITVFLTGLGMFGAVSFVPLFIQAVQGDSATDSGQALTPMMLALVASSIVAGQLLSRTGKYRALGVAGMALATVGMFLLSTMTVTTERMATVIYMVVMGLGLGVAMPLYTLVVQNAFPFSRMGVVTSAVTFFRSIGGTIGIAVLGALLNNRFQQAFVANLERIDPEVASRMPQEFVTRLTPQALVNPEALAGIRSFVEQTGGGQIPPAGVERIVGEITEAMRPALSTATTESFLIGTVTLAVAVVATAFIKELPLQRTNARPAAPAEGGAIEGIALNESPPVMDEEEAAGDMVGAGAGRSPRRSSDDGQRRA